MDLPGMRYRILATRCRQSADTAETPVERAALLQMATSYDRRAAEIERDWRQRGVAASFAAERPMVAATPGLRRSSRVVPAKNKSRRATPTQKYGSDKVVPIGTGFCATSSASVEAAKLVGVASQACSPLMGGSNQCVHRAEDKGSKRK